MVTVEAVVDAEDPAVVKEVVVSVDEAADVGVVAVTAVADAEDSVVVVDSVAAEEAVGAVAVAVREVAEDAVHAEAPVEESPVASREARV